MAIACSSTKLWPRGIRKADLPYDYWAKELTPSTAARKAFGHKAENFDAFKERYLGELNASDAAHACAQQLKKDAAKAAAPSRCSMRHATPRSTTRSFSRDGSRSR